MAVQLPNVHQDRLQPPQVGLAPVQNSSCSRVVVHGQARWQRAHSAAHNGESFQSVLLREDECFLGMNIYTTTLGFPFVEIFFPGPNIAPNGSLPNAPPSRSLLHSMVSQYLAAPGGLNELNKSPERIIVEDMTWPWKSGGFRFTCPSTLVGFRFRLANGIFPSLTILKPEIIDTYITLKSYLYIIYTF